MKKFYIVVVLIMMLLTLGEFVSIVSTKGLKYVSTVSLGTRVYTDSTDSSVSGKQAAEMFHALVRGAPSPFALGGAIITRKIVIHDVVEQQEGCNRYSISLHTLFNIKYMGPLNVSEVCGP